MKTNLDTLRPTNLDAFVGQPALRRELRVAIKACVEEKRPLDHILLVGPAGAGKTTVAGLVAAELQDNFLATEMPFEDEDYRALRDFQSGIFFIDEIHRGTHAQLEELLSLLLKGYLRPKGRPRITPDWVTVIAATTATDKGRLPKTLVQRFTMQPAFDPYTDDDLVTIATNMAKMAELKIGDTDLQALAHAAGGIPRKVSTLVRRGRALQVAYNRPVTADEILDLCRIEPDGLDQEHVRYLTVMVKQDRSMGLMALKNVLDTDEKTIRETERLLRDLDLIVATSHGRELTTAGYRRAKELTQKGTER